MKAIVFISIGWALGACSTVKSGMDRTAKMGGGMVRAATVAPAPETVDDVGRASGLTDAVMTPLRDMNLRRQEVPPLLAHMGGPYDDPANGSCEGLAREIADYDIVLGPDLDAPPPETGMGEAMAKAPVNLAEDGAADLMPFRGLVRRLSGASSRDRQLRRLYRIGAARRGYLKGLHRAADCSEDTLIAVEYE